MRFEERSTFVNNREKQVFTNPTPWAMKGSTNNPNGRPKGAANKLTREVREKIAAALESGLETFEEDLKALDPKDRLNILAKFAAFVVPRPQPEPEEEKELERKLPSWMLPQDKIEITRRVIQGRED